jgi:hypothetical protein
VRHHTNCVLPFTIKQLSAGVIDLFTANHELHPVRFVPNVLPAAGARKAAGQPRRRKKLVVEQVSPTLGSSKSKGAR